MEVFLMSEEKKKIEIVDGDGSNLDISSLIRNT